MDTILDNFASDKLFPNSNLLDLEDLNESDFLSNVVSQKTPHLFQQQAGHKLVVTNL